MTTGKKPVALIIWIFVSKVMSLFLNMLSRFVIALLLRSKSFNFMAAVIVCSDLGVQENKICHCFHFSPFYLPWSVGMRCHNLSFLECWVLSQVFHSPLPPSSRSSLSSIRVSICISEVVILLPTILIPACASPSPAFHMLYYAYKLDKQGDSMQPWCTPFPICN